MFLFVVIHIVDERFVCPCFLEPSFTIAFAFCLNTGSDSQVALAAKDMLPEANS